MTGTVYLLLALAAVAAMFDWWSVLRDHLGVEFIAKPMVIVFLIGVALEIETSDNVVRGIVIAALGASLVGDVVLMTPDARFEAGLLAFLVAHIFYIIALVPDFNIGPALAAAILVVAIGFGVVPELFEAVRRHGRITTVGVAVYMAALAFMTVFAAGTGVVAAAVGGALFLASDALLGWSRFVAPAPGGRVLVHVTYHFAQLGLVLWLAS